MILDLNKSWFNSVRCQWLRVFLFKDEGSHHGHIGKTFLPHRLFQGHGGSFFVSRVMGFGVEHCEMVMGCYGIHHGIHGISVPDISSADWGRPPVLIDSKKTESRRATELASLRQKSVHSNKVLRNQFSEWIHIP